MQNPVRILVINPNSDENTSALIRRTAEAFPLEGCLVDVTCLTTAPKLVISYEDRIVAVDELIRILRQNADSYDAFVLACHADPNLELAQEIISKPVVGIAEASMKLAASMGCGFAVISPSPKSRSKKYALAHKYHLDALLKGVVVSKSDDREDLLEAAREALNISCVDSIVLGCANYTGADGYLEKQLGVPVLDGVACALFIAAGLARYQRYKSDSNSRNQQ